MRDPFEDQVVALIPRMRAYAMSLTGSSVEADDVVQDALMRALRFREGFEMGTNLRAWLYRIVRNTFYSAAAKRRDTVEDVDGYWAGRLTASPDQEWRVQYGEIMDAMGELTPDSRDALLLVVASGLSYQEAAEVCGCAIGTMKSRVNRARERLAQLVDFAPEHAPRRSGTAGRGHDPRPLVA
jgi:RNA polymerase sigma-70 factor (ECF subfamily)